MTSNYVWWGLRRDSLQAPSCGLFRCTPRGLATAPSSLRLPAPLEGPGHAFPGMPAHRDRCSQDISLCPARPFRGLQRAFTSHLARLPPKPRPGHKPAQICDRPRVVRRADHACEAWPMPERLPVSGLSRHPVLPCCREIVTPPSRAARGPVVRTGRIVGRAL